MVVATQQGYQTRVWRHSIIKFYYVNSSFTMMQIIPILLYFTTSYRSAGNVLWLICCKFRTYSVPYMRDQNIPFSMLQIPYPIPYLINGIKKYLFSISISMLQFRTYSVPYTRNQKRTFSVCYKFRTYIRNQKACYKFRTLYAESKHTFSVLFLIPYIFRTFSVYIHKLHYIDKFQNVD